MATEINLTKTISKSAPHLNIGGRRVGSGEPVYIIAEMSANHNQDFERAVKIVEAASEAGADAIKLQTYTPETLTIDSDRGQFLISGGTPWDGRTLYELYGAAFMPWEWHLKLKEVAQRLGLDLFSTAYDDTALEFLEDLNVPVHKVASFEMVDIPLIEKMARTGKPLIISTGMASVSEIEETVSAARAAGATQIALLKCTSAYPARPEEMNLLTIPDLASTFEVQVGLSDHTLGVAVPVASVALGGCIIEKHFTISRDVPGPDSGFSLEPAEFKAMVDAVRTVEKALGKVHYGGSEREVTSRKFRRSLFVVQDMKAGEEFSAQNVRSIRPGDGLPPKYLRDVIGRRTTVPVSKGTPLSWDLIR
jgi:N-acetylneuraminate synthase